MYPASAGASNASATVTSKFQNRCASPQFASFAPPPPGDYPSAMHPHQTTSANVHQAPSTMGHGGSMSMRGHHQATRSTLQHGHPHGGHGLAATLGHHHHHLIFPDDMDSIEFCMPAPPSGSSSSSSQQNGGGGGGEQLLLGNHGEAFTERRRRGHSRRSNHKMDVEQQVKWSRKNIAATMERFEPTTNTQSSSSTSSLDYGFAAGVMTPSSSSVTPSHGGGGGGMSSNPSLHVAAVGGAASGGGAIASAPFNHVYSYAYYEPGAAKCHTNVPSAIQGNGVGIQVVQGHSKSPPRNSIRALLAKSFRSKSSSHSGQSTSSSPSAEERDRHTYTTRYGTTENLYEEVSEQKIRKVLSDNRIATSSVGNVKEEQRRVQHNHFRVLDELNLSLEALIMPPTPPDISPSHAMAGISAAEEQSPQPSAMSVAAGSSTASGAGTVQAKTVQRVPRRGGLLGGAAASAAASNSSSASHASLENLSSTLNSMELKDHAHSSCINPEFDEGDLDSGFSGSGSSSGASYNESLRYYKSATPNISSSSNNNNNHNNNNNTLPHQMRSCRSSTASGTSTSKSSMASCGEDQGIGMQMQMAMGMTPTQLHNMDIGSLSPFNYPRRCSADQQRASGRSLASNAGMGTVTVTGTGTMAPPSTVATGTKPKKNFWTMKP